MFIKKFHSPGIFVNSYLLSDSVSREAVVVDPTRDVEPILVFAKNEGFVITHIIRTRTPSFYISGVKELLHRLDNKPSFETKEFSLGSIKLKPQSNGNHTIWLGFDLKRSKDVPAIAFTGEALLVGSVGRPDIISNLYQILFDDLSSLSDFVEIYPGLSAGSIAAMNVGAKDISTIGYEKLFNPYYQKLPEDQWTKKMMTQLPAKPDTLEYITQTNEKGPQLLSELGGLTQEGPTLYIDVRSPEAYAKGHLTDSLNIPLGPSFCNWALGVLEHHHFPVTIVHDNHMHIPTALKYLCLIGFDKFTDYLFWNEEELGREYLILENPLISVDEVKQQLKDLTILDVRTSEEWNRGHIDGATHVELNKLRQSIDKIPRDKPIRVICGSGYRSSVAASFLKASGFDDVRNIEGGMHAWNAKYPLK